MTLAISKNASRFNILFKFKNFCYYLNVDSNNEINEVEDTKNKSSKKLLYIFLAALLVFGLGYYFLMPTVLEQASENCDVPSGPFGFKIDEDGKGAYMDGAVRMMITFSYFYFRPSLHSRRIGRTLFCFFENPKY